MNALSIPLLKWLLVGVLFAIFNVVTLYILIDLLMIPIMVSTVVAAEVGTLIRFFVNDHWVFEQTRPTWRRLIQYHVANAGGVAIWWAVTNTVVLIGWHYTLASLCGMAISMQISILTNFFWIWRRR